MRAGDGLYMGTPPVECRFIVPSGGDGGGRPPKKACESRYMAASAALFALVFWLLIMGPP